MQDIDEVTDLDIAFGTVAGLPKWEDIPDEFKRNGTKWNTLFSQLFYKGGAGVMLDVKDGTDLRKASRWIKAHMASFEPKHEHKEAGIAYKMSQWFEDWKMEDSPGKTVSAEEKIQPSIQEPTKTLT